MQEIDYTFDAVNNITGISNAAGVLNNGLGGTYNHNYSYDNSYRLISSNGLWDNNNNSLDYQLNLVYSRDGRILTKTQSATTLTGGMLSNFSYDNEYKYNTKQPHTVKEVFDVQNHGNQHFNWDANGNLIFHKTQFPVDNIRSLCWDEENRLMAVGDNNYTSYYQYDNSGERTYKLTGKNTLMNINGRWVNFATMDNPTLYTSAYLVAGVQGYTKHYYAGSERVSSAIGLGGLENINDPLPIEFGGSWDEKSGSLMEEMNRIIVECLKNDYNIATSLHFLHGMTSPTAGTMDRYFYHPDHLGSSVSTPLNNHRITDGSGNAIQHLHYLPFGEDWVDQRNGSWSAPYTFSGKEKDVETGYSYFGARYYDSGLSIWLSVDPLSDKYPNLTPYAYCANNPVILVDPDGREVEWHPDGNGNLIADKGDNYETLCEYLSTIYGGLENIPGGELLRYKFQLSAYKGLDIEGISLKSTNGTFDNLVGKYLVTKSREFEYWGERESCSPTTFNRVRLAVKYVYGKDLLGKELINNPIYASWNGILQKGYPLWGSPLIEYLGLGILVNENNFSNGLKPGAVLGLQGKSGGHSVIFLGYKEDGSGIIEWGNVGIRERLYSENGFYSKKIKRAANFR